MTLDIVVYYFVCCMH